MPRHPAISPTASGLSDRVYSELTAKARGARVFPLHVGDSWLEPPVSLRAESQRTARHPHLHAYPPVQGEPTLIDAIVEMVARRGLRIDRAHVQVTLGATSGLAVVCDTLLDPGDEVLLLAPFWPLIRGIIRSRGARAVEIPFFTRLDELVALGESGIAALLESHVGPRTAAIYVNSPHNPTGRVLPVVVLDAIARVAAKHDLWVIADAAYDDLAYVPQVAPWAHEPLLARTVAAHTLSKSYAAAGIRVGFLHGPEEAMSAIRAVHTFRAYAAPRAFQLGAARTLHEGASWLAEARSIYEAAGRRAARVLGVPPPEGGSFLFFDTQRFLREGETTCVPFLERALAAGVLLTPGSACGDDYARWSRLCFTCVPPSDLDDALAALHTVL